MLRKSLTRRNLLLGAASLTTTLLAACRGPRKETATLSPSVAPPTPFASQQPELPSPTPTKVPTPTPSPLPSPTPTPTPKTVNIWVNPSNPARFTSTSDRLIAQISAETSFGPLDVQQVQTAAQADLRVTTQATDPNTTIALASVHLVPVCSPRTPVRSITTEQMTALLSGTTSDWSSAGSPTSLKVEPFVIDGLRLTGTVDTAATVATFDDFVAQLSDHPGAIALAAVDDVDFRAGSLAVNDIDLLALPEPPDDWPFVIDLFVTGQQTAWQYVEAINAPVASDSEAGKTVPPLTVTFVGDVILGRTVHTIMTRLNDYSAPFRLVADELKKTDLTIANLECSLADDITPPTDPYTFSFMTFTAGGDGLVLSGVDAVTQANNHSMNFGAKGMRDTLAALDQRKILHFGIGENLSEARKPVVFDRQGRRIALLGYDGITGTTYGATDSTPGTSPLDVDLMTEDIMAVRPEADLVIPFVHWGIEYKLVPDAEQRAIARKAIDAGADMVIGSHCHWVQGMEIYKGKPIIYSLANFVFDQDWSLETKQGLIMHLVFRRNRLAAIRFVPVLIENFYRPRIVDGAQMTQILDRIWESTDILLSTQ